MTAVSPTRLRSERKGCAGDTTCLYFFAWRLTKDGTLMGDCLTVSGGVLVLVLLLGDAKSHAELTLWPRGLDAAARCAAML